MKFIKLEGRDGTPIWVNPINIMLVREGNCPAFSFNTEVVLTDGVPLYVDESVEEIVSAINAQLSTPLYIENLAKLVK